jgi:hypothetical protein
MKDSSVPDMFDKITGESTVLGKIAGAIPGFSGYMERSRRRQADQILRQTIASRLENSRLQLANVHQEISRDMFTAIEHAEPLGRADTRLMGLIGKIKDAPQGYAGFFDAVKVKEDDLARLYEFDERMLVHSEEIVLAVAALEKAAQEKGDIDGNIRALDRALQEANTAFSSRQEVLSGVATDK